MFAQGEDARTIMAVLGHSQISTTMDLYTHMMPSTMRDVATPIDALLNHAEENCHLHYLISAHFELHAKAKRFLFR